MKFNKDSIIPLVLIMAVTVFFHFRHSAAQKQIDIMAADVSSMKTAVQEITFVMKNELKLLKDATASLKNMKEKEINIDQKDLDELKKKVEAMSFGQNLKKSNTMLCEGGQDGVIKLYESGKFEFYESATQAVTNSTGKGTYNFSGPFFVYSGFIKDEKGRQKKISGRAMITHQEDSKVAGVNLDNAVYTTALCNEGVITKFK
ncbi:MAG: hypothetical protein EP319_18290 [Deltaproteobacteria bacterium]|nr:MAG: hypothetical protein EP319_18290 [Deltaproteobacteria bacterium]